jgi:hypothetical protein
LKEESESMEVMFSIRIPPFPREPDESLNEQLCIKREREI